MKRAITFYTNILGLELISESADFSQVGGEKFWIALQINATTVDERSKSDGPIIVFKTTDIEQKYHELKTKGVNFHKPPYDVVPGITAAEFMDYEGNKLAMSNAD
jgi:predicted enzyme related to lactoylglutathione lyase